jgi:integrase
LTVSGINQMFHRRLKQAGLPMYRVHDLRHTFTKEAIRQGKSLSSLQRQLGHATPDMVLRYAKTFSEEQKEEFSNFGDDE